MSELTDHSLWLLTNKNQYHGLKWIYKPWLGLQCLNRQTKLHPAFFHYGLMNHGDRYEFMNFHVNVKENETGKWLKIRLHILVSTNHSLGLVWKTWWWQFRNCGEWEVMKGLLALAPPSFPHTARVQQLLAKSTFSFWPIWKSRDCKETPNQNFNPGSIPRFFHLSETQVKGLCSWRYLLPMSINRSFNGVFLLS